MKLTLVRGKSTEHSTPGVLSIDGVFSCYALEDIQRDVKIKDQTAIPLGTYDVIINMSNRFKRLLPLLLNVPNFEGIRIHPGNTDADTSGCILVGDSHSTDFVGSSRTAFMRLFNKMCDARDAGESITIEITGE